MLFVALAMGLAGWLVVDRAAAPRQGAVPPAGHRVVGRAGPAVPDARATALLSTLARRLRHGTADQVAALAAPGRPASRQELTDLADNVRRLGLADLSLRYLAADPHQLSVAQRRRFGRSAWVADVALTWRVAGYDRATSRQELPVVLDRSRRGTVFVTARAGSGSQIPLWLLDSIVVRRSRQALVLAAAGSGVASDAQSLLRQAGRAVGDVRRVLPDWVGGLVLEVPGSEQQLDRTLGATTGDYVRIAAVTTTEDGSERRGAPEHVFVNPRVFDPLGPRGAQIVLSHEATHVALRAATSRMPPWLLEGFADYVAFAHAHLPVAVTAGQILADVRRHGVPDHLPSASELSGSNPTVGASYEAAWLACRLIAARYGEAALVELYRRSDAAGSTTRAFREVLGTDRATFTRAWQAYLRRLA